MTTPTPEALAQAEQIVSDLLHSHDTEQDVEIIARALIAWDERPREPQDCRVPEKRGLHVGYPRQGGLAPDGGIAPKREPPPGCVGRGTP